MKEKGLWLIGTDEKATQPLYDLDLTHPLALLMGAEGHGLRRLTRELCDFIVHIPMADRAQGLNVSVAAGVCLFEAQRQRRH
jgi:23S rRNA (guanosine2251-2'-O)-methyltransferase